MHVDETSSPFLDQILARAFETISEHPAFDEELLEHLRGLAESGDLLEFERVVTALKTGEEQ